MNCKLCGSYQCSCGIVSMGSQHINTYAIKAGLLEEENAALKAERELMDRIIVIARGGLQAPAFCEVALERALTALDMYREKNK